MNKLMFKTKRSQSELLALILSFMVIGSSVIVGTNVTLNSTNITGDVILESQKIVSEIINIEVWADTLLEVNNEKISLRLDDGSSLAGKELEIYFDGILNSTQITDENGNAFLTPLSASPGNLSIKFLGNPSLYLNPSELIINSPDKVEISSEACQEFEEQILWSSGFSNDKKGSLNYDVWYPKYNCSEIGENNCFIKDVEIESRLVSVDNPDGKTEGEGYVQISELNNCDEPENGIYSDYLAFDKSYGEEVKKGKYCKEGKDDVCENISGDIENYNSCYGIKIYGSQYLITDVFFVNYKLCGVKDEN